MGNLYVSSQAFSYKCLIYNGFSKRPETGVPKGMGIAEEHGSAKVLKGLRNSSFVLSKRCVGHDGQRSRSRRTVPMRAIAPNLGATLFPCRHVVLVVLQKASCCLISDHFYRQTCLRPPAYS